MHFRTELPAETRTRKTINRPSRDTTYYVLRHEYLTGRPFRGLYGPAFFSVRTPRARTHQQQLACIAHHVFNRCAESKKRRKFSSFGMHEPACQLLVYTEWTHTHQCTECTHSACLNVYTVYTQQGADRVQTAYTRNNLASKNRLMYSCWCTQCT